MTEVKTYDNPSGSVKVNRKVSIAGHVSWPLACVTVASMLRSFLGIMTEFKKTNFNHYFLQQAFFNTLDFLGIS